VEEAPTHCEAKGYVDGGEGPLEDDHGHHDPWSLVFLLDENITADPTECKVDAWTPVRQGCSKQPSEHTHRKRGSRARWQ
jgi:hypothetical protein